MARTYEDIMDLRAGSRRDSEIQGLPLGYISGGKLTLVEEDAGEHVDVDPLVANIKGKQVVQDATYTIVDGDFLHSRVAGCAYYVYLDEAGIFHVDALAPNYNSSYHADYHPQYNNYRCLGKFHIDDNNAIDYAFATAKVDELYISEYQLNDDSVSTDKIQASAITTTELLDDAVTAAKIINDAVEEAKIKNGAVSGDKIAVDAVTADKILAGSVTTAKLDAAAVTTVKLDAASVTAAKIEAGTITSREMTFGVNDDDIATDADEETADEDAGLFDLSQPDCVGSKGTRPEVGKEIVYAPGVATDETGKEYPGFHSPRMIGQSEAIFQASTNLVKSPEDLTTSDWATSGAPIVVLTDQYVNGKRLTKIVNTGAASDYVAQTHTTAFTQVQIGGSVICRKGKSVGNTTRFYVFDSTTWDPKFWIVIDFDNYPNAPGTAGAGTLHNYTWIDEDTIEIQWIGTLDAAGNNCQIRCFGSDHATDGEYTYWTAVQLEDLPYPTPYIDRYRWPTGVRPAVSPNYAVTMPEKFVFKMKIRPWFTYDIAGYPHFFGWYIDGSHRFLIYYNPGAPDKIYILWQDGGTARYLFSEQFDDGSNYYDISSEIILFGAIDLSTQTGNNAFFAIVDRVKQAEDNDWTGAPDAKVSTFSTLSIGHRGDEKNHADSLIEYAKFWQWDGSSLGTLNDETDIDRVTADLTSLFDLELEDHSNARYKPVSKQGAIGIFQKTTNLVDFPEDLTDASWLDENGNITPSLSDYYINGKRFTKLLVTNTSTAFTYKDVEVTTATPSFQAIFKHGLSDVTVINLAERGVATRGTITITWTTKTIAASNGATNLEYEWISDDTVWVAATAASVNTSNDVEIRIYPDTSEAANDYIYVTAVMVEDVVYPTPYTPTERAKDGILNYPFEMPEKFTVMFWVRPWFTYNGGSKYFVEWFIDATHRFLVYFEATGDLITVLWQDGGTARYLYSQQFDDGLSYNDINQWIMVALAFDAAGGQTGSRLKVYADTIGEDTDFGGAIDAKTSSFPTLSIGQENGTQEADSFISDLLILPNQLLTAEQMDRHYWKTRPWHSPGEVASFDKSVRIDRSGIRLHNAELNITDWRNRQILISNQDGLMAKDAAGTVIHDIPDAPIQSGRYYCGHLNWFREQSSYVIYDEVTPPDEAWTPVTCLLENNTNVRAGLFKVWVYSNLTEEGENYVYLVLRPKGSGWDSGITANAPALYTLTNPLLRVNLMGLLMCPIGDDNSIDFFFNYPPTASSKRLLIAQLGIFI